MLTVGSDPEFDWSVRGGTAQAEQIPGKNNKIKIKYLENRQDGLDSLG